MSNFFNKVYKAVNNVPKGKVTTYGAIADYFGYPPLASRTVGWAMKQATSDISWHRVVKKKGELPFPEFSDSFKTQKKMLIKENISFIDKTHIDMNKHFWNRWIIPT
jgi:methylated-DNA-protein-cysteine methyltransferase related protein